MYLEWKQNWPETRRHMEDWWRHKGLVVGMWGTPQADPPRETGFACEPALSIEHGYAGPAARARRNHALLAGRSSPAISWRWRIWISARIAGALFRLRTALR